MKHLYNPKSIWTSNSLSPSYFLFSAKCFFANWSILVYILVWKSCTWISIDIEWLLQMNKQFKKAYIDRYSSHLTKTPFSLILQIWQLYSALDTLPPLQSQTLLVLTILLIISYFWKVDCDTLPLHRALEKSEKK